MNSENSSTKFTNSVFSWSLFGSASQKPEKKNRTVTPTRKYLVLSHPTCKSQQVHVLKVERSDKSGLGVLDGLSVPAQNKPFPTYWHTSSVALLCCQLEARARAPKAAGATASHPIHARCSCPWSAVQRQIEQINRQIKRGRGREGKDIP